jgi:hypothetical protein
MERAYCGALRLPTGSSMSGQERKRAFRVALPFFMAACWASVSSAILLMALTRFALGH